VVVYFGSVFVNYRSGQNIIATFNCRLSYEVILTKTARATLWAIFSQTHPVTLSPTDFCSARRRELLPPCRKKLDTSIIVSRFL
jgi:hypothetical protein